MASCSCCSSLTGYPVSSGTLSVRKPDRVGEGVALDHDLQDTEEQHEPDSEDGVQVHAIASEYDSACPSTSESVRDSRVKLSSRLR